MISHIKVDAPPIIQSQVLKDLGKVNIITGKNSAGKSTILHHIKEHCDAGIIYSSFEEISGYFDHARRHTQASHAQIDEWIKVAVTDLSETIIFNSDKGKTRDILEKTKQKALGNRPLYSETELITDALTLHTPERKNILFLSPKRRLPHKVPAATNDTLDAAAQSALSRLFLLKNQEIGSPEKIKYEFIGKSFTQITGREFDIKLVSKTTPPEIQLLFKREGGEWINAENEGLGLPEVLSIILYAIDGDYTLLLIEEPENHLHPDYQRKLLSFLQSVQNRQFIISTHSPIFLNPTLVDKIFCTNFADGQITIDDSTSRADALSNIGVLSVDNLTSDAIIMSEGITDYLIIDHIVKQWLGARSNAWISRVLLGGSSMMYIDLSPFAENRNVFVILDRDPANAHPQKVFTENCTTAGITPKQLSRYSIENYYTVQSIREVFGERVPEGLVRFTDDEPIWEQLASAAYPAKQWKGDLKTPKNIQNILAHMTVSDIEHTDFLDFCLQVKQVL